MGKHGCGVMGGWRGVCVWPPGFRSDWGKGRGGGGVVEPDISGGLRPPGGALQHIHIVCVLSAAYSPLRCGPHLHSENKQMPFKCMSLVASQIPAPPPPPPRRRDVLAAIDQIKAVQKHWQAGPPCAPTLRSSPRTYSFTRKTTKGRPTGAREGGRGEGDGRRT